MNSYLGKLLYADLIAGELRDECLDPNLARAFVGGAGLGFRDGRAFDEDA